MNYKNLIIFLVGACCGAGASYLYLNKKSTDEIQKYREELRELYLSKQDEKSSDDKEKSNHEKERDEIINRLNNLVANDNKDVVDYAKNYISDEPEERTYEEETRIEQLDSMRESREHPKDDEPYIITEEEFADPSPMYDKITLEYFIKDDIVIDSLSHEIVDVPDTIGEEHIQMIRNGEFEEDDLYIRNDAKGIDYEVLINDGDYEESEKGYHGIY